MGDGTHEKRLRLAETLRKHPEIAETLFSAAHRHMRNTADAEDLFQETLRIAFEPGRSLDPDDPVALRSALGSIMNNRAANRWRADRRHPTTPYVEQGTSGDDEATPIAEAHHSAAMGAPIPNPERALIERQEDARRQATKAAIREALAADDTAKQMFDLADTGVRGSAEFAKRIGCSMEEVYRAQRRITRHAQRLSAHRDEEAKRAS